MRTSVRVGAIVGGVAFVVLYAAQTSVALAAVYGIVVAGFCAGLGAAKWLEREWYGRQFGAGLRAGALAASIAGLGTLLSLVVLGPHDVAALAARSRLVGVSFAPIAHRLGFLGWMGTDLLTVAGATLFGTAIAAFTCQVFAWSKSARAVRVVTQARLAAQALNRDEVYRATGAPSTYGPAVRASNQLPPLGVSTPGAAPFTGSTPALGIIPPPTFSPSSVPAPASQQRRTAAPATPFAGVPSRASASPANRAAEHAPTEPIPPAHMPVSADSLARQSPSAARRADGQLTDAMRDALAAWAHDNDAPTKKPAPARGKGKSSRTPAPSAYLNSAPPAKRSRKKQDTQDWLC